MPFGVFFKALIVNKFYHVSFHHTKSINTITCTSSVFALYIGK